MSVEIFLGMAHVQVLLKLRTIFFGDDAHVTVLAAECAIRNLLKLRKGAAAGESVVSYQMHLVQRLKRRLEGLRARIAGCARRLELHGNAPVGREVD